MLADPPIYTLRDLQNVPEHQATYPQLFACLGTVNWKVLRPVALASVSYDAESQYEEWRTFAIHSFENPPLDAFTPRFQTFKNY